MPEMFRIKICGVKTVADANVVVDSGADAVGLNFYTGSKRYVAPDLAQDIAASIPDSVAKVGVFVNSSIDSIRSITQQVNLDWIQLHGDESPNAIAELTELRLIKAFRLDGSGIQPVIEFLRECSNLGRTPDALLLDAYDPTQFGGTGRTIDWSRLASETPLMGGSQWVLAGGLTPQNVARAIEQTEPSAVDTASGVESSPGVKDSKLSSSFVDQARDAFRRLA